MVSQTEIIYKRHFPEAQSKSMMATRTRVSKIVLFGLAFKRQPSEFDITYAIKEIA